jgi:hypothetical protein
VTEVPETGWYELSFGGLERTIRAETFDGMNMTVYQTGFPIVSPDEDLVAGIDFNRAWQRENCSCQIASRQTSRRRGCEDLRRRI